MSSFLLVLIEKDDLNEVKKFSPSNLGTLMYFDPTKQGSINMTRSQVPS
jgi:hypothetical protein